MHVRLTQLDGALPNLALMKLAAWHRALGDVPHITRKIEPDLFEPDYGKVYGSSIFDFSSDRLERFQRAWPGATVGGTGTGNPVVVESITGNFDGVEYDGYPEFRESIGFTQRGCRLKCKFCVVPGKEGKPRSAATIAQIWRGKGHPRKLHLLDNDFFGNPEWRERINEIRDGRFRVCLSQGINVRLIYAEAASALATIEYRDTKFKERRLYTAWDNLGDEAIFFRGVETLERAGIPSKHLMAYMLIGFDPLETWGRIWHRFNRMVERGIKPYPMVYNRRRADLRAFQRWVLTGLYRIVPWDAYECETKSEESVAAWLAAAPLLKPYLGRSSGSVATTKTKAQLAREKAQRERQRLEAEVRKAVYMAGRAHAATVGLGLEDLRDVAREYWARHWHDWKKVIAAWWIPEAPKAEKKPGRRAGVHDRIDALGKRIATMDGADLIRLLLDCALVGGVMDNRNAYVSSSDFKHIEAFAKRHGVDPAAIRKQVAAAAGAEKAPAKKKAAKP